jgi:hypothetical protein
MMHTQSESNALKNAISVREDLVVPEPQHSVALSFEEVGPHGVRTPLKRVLAAVKLDDELGFGAAEIRDEGADGMLSPELELRQPPVPQSPPQFPLCIRL